MPSKTILKKRLAFRESALEKLYDAYESIASGKVKSYQIDDRTLTKLDLQALGEEIRALENEIDALENALSGARARKAYAVVPRGW